MSKQVTIRYSVSLGEYRVPAPDRREESSYYTDSKEDALGTARHMWREHDVTFTVRRVWLCQEKEKPQQVTVYGDYDANLMENSIVIEEKP